ncbi:MAG: hypothetical protein WBQ73_01645 [Candidatus Babeliales bacterium]
MADLRIKFAIFYVIGLLLGGYGGVVLGAKVPQSALQKLTHKSVSIRSFCPKGISINKRKSFATCCQSPRRHIYPVVWLADVDNVLKLRLRIGAVLLTGSTVGFIYNIQKKNDASIEHDKV